MAHRLDWLFGFCIALSDSRFLEAEAMSENEFTKFQTAIEVKSPVGRSGPQPPWACAVAFPVRIHVHQETTKWKGNVQMDG